MRLTVFGATGGTGQEVVRRALAAGHKVTAVVRDPTRLEPRDGLEVVTGDVMNSRAMVPVVEGHDAVLSALGGHPRGPTSVCLDGTRAMTEAMGVTGVRRIVALSMAPVTVEGDDPVTRFLAKPILRRTLRYPRADAMAMERHLRTTDLDWTVLRPPMLTNGPATGRYRTARGRNLAWGMRITRADLAEAVLATVADASTHQTPLGVAR